MGFSIQFESQHVELWGCYTMERDEDILEMYDQPIRIQLHYHARSGRKTSPWHTPDFLVLRKDGVVFEEWKHASSLEKLTVTMPERYQRRAKGGWLCPPGKQASRELGLSYHVRTSAEYHPLYIENLKFLQDFLTVAPTLLNAPTVRRCARWNLTKVSSDLNLTTNAKQRLPIHSNDGPGLIWPGAWLEDRKRETLCGLNH